jgi:F-type H+-transporting ATPase subunit a
VCSIFDKFLSSLWEHLRPGGRDIGESIRAAINFAPQFYLKIGRFTIPVTGAMISLIASVILLTILAFWLRRGLKKYELSGKQALTEKLYFAVISLGVSSGLKRDQSETVLPWTLGIGLYIFTSNVVAIAEMSASAVNPAVPVSLALYTLVFVIAMGIHLVGIKGFGHSLIDPMPGLLPFNILDYMIKPSHGHCVKCGQFLTRVPCLQGLYLGLGPRARHDRHHFHGLHIRRYLAAYRQET